MTYAATGRRCSSSHHVTRLVTLRKRLKSTLYTLHLWVSSQQDSPQKNVRQRPEAHVSMSVLGQRRLGRFVTPRRLQVGRREPQKSPKPKSQRARKENNYTPSAGFLSTHSLQPFLPPLQATTSAKTLAKVSSVPVHTSCATAANVLQCFTSQVKMVKAQIQY